MLSQYRNLDKLRLKTIMKELEMREIVVGSLIANTLVASIPDPAMLIERQLASSLSPVDSE